MKRPVLRAWYVVVLASVTACSTGSNGSAVSTSQACADWASANCKKFQSCAPFLIQRDFGDLATCTSRLALACPPNAMPSGSTLTPGALEACDRAYQTATCADYLSNKNPSACAFKGSLAVGAVCAADDQCANGYCQALVPAACGVCATRSPVGGACFSDLDCEQTGLTCGAGTCVPLAVLGAACDQAHPCEPVLYCSSAGSCVARLGLGAACDPTTNDDPCDGTTGLYCNQVSSLCVQAPVSTAGGPCGLTADGTLSICGAAGACQLPDGATTGTCQAAVLEGAACDPLNGPNCLPPGTCLGNVCGSLDPSTCH